MGMAFQGILCYTTEMISAMRRSASRFLAVLSAMLLPVVAFAQGAGGCPPGQVAACPSGAARCVCVSSGYAGGLPELILRVINFLSYFIGAFCTVAFLIGAFLIVLSKGEEPLLPRGKNLIIESLIGMAIVLGAQGILRLVVYVLYVPA